MNTTKKMTFNFNVTPMFPYAMAFSFVLVFGSLILLFTKGLNFGVDFRGGAEIQVKFATPVEAGKLREVLVSNGMDGASVQTIGEETENEFLVKVQASGDKISQTTDTISKLLETTFTKEGAEIRKTDVVGPKAGEELKMSAIQAVFWSLIAIMVYISLRFDFKYAPGAIISLFHDVMVIIGFFVITQKEFSLQIVGAVLAIVGYSINDTVVVYDRVRENEEKNPSGKLNDHLDRAVNETLARTILTSLTTITVSVALLFFGGDVLHDFAFAMCVGLVSGVYSTIFIAAPVTMLFDKFNRKRSEHKKIATT